MPTLYNRDGQPINVSLNPGDTINGNMIISNGNSLTPDQYLYQNSQIAGVLSQPGYGSAPRPTPNAHSSVDATNIDLAAQLAALNPATTPTPTPITPPTPVPITTPAVTNPNGSTTMAVGTNTGSPGGGSATMAQSVTPTTQAVGTNTGASTTGGGTVTTGGGTTGGGTSTTLNPNVTTTDLINQLIQQLMTLQNTEGRGLSPGARAALTTNALESVPGRFDQAGRDLTSTLLRRGGGLPAGGELLRAFGPLVAERESTRAGLLRDIVLADEEARNTSREADRKFGLDTLRTAGDLAIGRGNLELGIGELRQRWDIANLDADTRTRLTQMGIDSNEKLGALDATLRRDLALMGINSQEFMSRLDADTRVRIAELQFKGDSTAVRAAASVASTLMNTPSFKGAIDDGVGWVLDKLIPGSTSTTLRLGAGSTAAIAGLIGPPGAMTTGGIASAGPIGATTGFGTKLAAFATNPITLGIAAAAAGAFILYKKFGTDHLRANQIVQEFENPFAQTFIYPMHTEFFKAAEAGKMSQPQAAAARSEFAAGWQEYIRQIDAWAGNDGSKRQVATQSRNNLGPLIQRITADMDRVIAAGGYDHAMAA